MNDLSIRLKITGLLGILVTLLIGILSMSIEKIIKVDIAEIERQKGEMIASTIEPTLAMNHFLQLDDENREFAQKILTNQDVLGLSIYFEGKPFLLRIPTEETQQLFNIVYPIRDVMTQEKIGEIELYYTKHHYEKTVETLYQRFIVVGAMIVALVLVVYFAIRYLFRPLEQITDAIGTYEIGQPIDFTGVRREKETNGVIRIVSELLDRVNRHNHAMEEKQEELHEAREAADSANASKSMFLANMSHEIRTPMNGIMGFAKLLEHSGLNTKQQRYAEIINASANALLGIINDILDFSKLESGKFELDPSKWNPFIEFEKITALFTARMDEKRITFERRIDPDVPECIEADLLRLGQVVTNLVGNAIKFTPEGGKITFYVKRIADLGSASVLRFGVRDSGIGIPKEKQEHIFEAFSQADSSTTRKFGGTGLGLSICSHLVSLMGGHIELESEPGQGSEFYFEITVNHYETEHSLSALFKELRVVLSEASEPMKPTQSKITSYLQKLRIPCEARDLSDLTLRPGREIGILFCNADRLAVDALLENGSTVIVICNEDHGWSMHHPRLLWIGEIDHNLSGLYNGLLRAAIQGHEDDLEKPIYLGSLKARGKVLVAEDNEVNQILIEEILKQWGLEYTIVSNGQEAIDRIAVESFDLVLMDVNMPVMGGVEAVGRIKASGIATPVVALTANAMEGDRERFLADGFDDYLTKPIVLEHFAVLMRRYLESAESKATVVPEVFEELESEKLVDMERIHRELGLPKKLIIRMLTSYLNTCDEYREALKSAIETADFEGIQMSAHSIKGAAANLALSPIVELTQTMEHAARKQEPIDYATLYAQLERLGNEAKSQIETLLASQS